MPETNEATATNPAPIKLTTWTPELVLTLLALLAQAFVTVELFAPASVAGKLISAAGIVLTGLGYSVARAKVARSALPVSLVLLVTCIGLSLATSCGATQRAGSVAANTIDCLAPTAAQAVATFAPALATVVRSATSPDGHVDWAPIKDTAASLKTPAAQCVLASVIKEALTPAKESATAPQSSPAALDTASLLAGWEAQRSEWGGARYQLAGGVL